MAMPHARPGEVVSILPWGPAIPAARTATLVRGEQVEVIRLVVPAGKEIEEHRAKGELLVHCLEGRVAFTALGMTQDLEAGDLLFLPRGEAHALKGIEDASLLLTIVLPGH
jgi:quercetin dioxygenase-like cupin family protein